MLIAVSDRLVADGNRIFAMEDIWIETAYGRIFGKTAGPEDGRLVLGVHGWSQRNGWHTWQPLLPPLGDAGFRAVSVDMPGWGKSEASRGQVTAADAVATVVQLLDGMGAETAVLMGKSWGGGIVLDVALHHPDRVSHLLLTAPARQNVDPLRQFRQPVLLAWAKDDSVIPYDQAARYVDAVPQIELVTYDTGGHSAAPKNAADFASRAIEFLQE